MESLEKTKNVENDFYIDWDVPKTDSGLLGMLDRFLGPGKTRIETSIEYLGGAICFGLAIVFMYSRNTDSVRTVGQWIIFILLALDLIGGVITNSTNAAKRRYHKDKNSTGRLTFVFAHTLHLALISWGLLVSQSVLFFSFNLILLVIGAVAIEKSPYEGRRPLAIVFLMIAIFSNLILFDLPVDLNWVPTLFFLKLLVCHLVPEAPMYRKNSDS